MRERMIDCFTTGRIGVTCESLGRISCAWVMRPINYMADPESEGFRPKTTSHIYTYVMAVHLHRWSGCLIVESDPSRSSIIWTEETGFLVA